MRVGEEPEASKTGGVAPRERVGEEPEASKNRGMAPRESGWGARDLEKQGDGSP